MKIRGLCCAVCIGLTAWVPAAADGHEAAIVAVIESAYVDGIWMQGDEAAARAGFDPSFVMQVSRDGAVASVTLDQWLERLGLHGEPLDEGITHEIRVLDADETAAVARVDVRQHGEPVYTDYMNLYRFDDGWRIVAKTFHSHR